jgi:organic radical activating enzyme
MRFVLVQGGEPLLRRDVPEILKDLSAIGVHLTLIMNGRIRSGHSDRSDHVDHPEKLDRLDRSDRSGSGRDR